MKKLITLAVLLINTVCFAQRYDLSLSLKQGETYNFSTNAKLDIVETVNGADQDITTDLSAAMSFKVIDVKDSLYTVEIRYKSLAMNMNLMGRSVSFNSESKDTSDVFSKMLSTIIDKPLTMELTKKGRVRSILGADDLYNHMFDQFPQVSEEKKAQAKKQIEQSFGAEAIKDNMQEIFAVFPETPASKGDKWSIKTAIKSILSVDINTIYTLADVTDNEFILHGEGTTKTASDAAYRNLGNLTVKLTDVSGTITSDIKLDKKTGWLVEEKDVKSLNATMNVADGPNTPGGMVIPMRMKIEITNTGSRGSF